MLFVFFFSVISQSRFSLESTSFHQQPPSLPQRQAQLRGRGPDSWLTQVGADSLAHVACPGPCLLPPVPPCPSASIPFRRLTLSPSISQDCSLTPHFGDKKTEVQKENQIAPRPQPVGGRPGQSPGLLALALVNYAPLVERL